MNAEEVAGALGCLWNPVLLSQCRAFWKMVFASVDGGIPFLATLPVHVLVSSSVRMLRV